MANEKATNSYPQSERQRKLQQVSFLPSTILSRDLPRDTVLKSLQIRLSGNVITTFASGTPVADAMSTIDDLIPRIDVVINGSRVVKSVRPHMMRMQQLFTNSILGERRSSAAATAATDNFPLTDGGFVYGTTGQISTAAETIWLSFEMTYAEVGLGRESTWLNLKGVASAEIRFTTNSFSSLLGFGNTTPVVYTSNNFVIDILTTEASDVPPTIIFSDWKQTLKQVSYSAQQTNALIDINRGNRLSGVMFFTQDGAAGSATTATGTIPNNLVLTSIQLLINGQTQVKTTDFKSLQAENKARYGINSPVASSVSLIDGVAYLNFLARKDLSTALPVRPPQVDQVQLVVNTNTSANCSYTNPVTISVMTEEVVEPR